uniref:Uncharacterized protein n=1 Tax=Anguilla anguilla TaxID=7936 RepID=A0A0E9T9N8_ANGAN
MQWSQDSAFFYAEKREPKSKKENTLPSIDTGILWSFLFQDYKGR